MLGSEAVCGPQTRGVEEAVEQEPESRVIEHRPTSRGDEETEQAGDKETVVTRYSESTLFFGRRSTSALAKRALNVQTSGLTAATCPRSMHRRACLRVGRLCLSADFELNFTH